MNILDTVDTTPLSETEQDNLWVNFKKGDMGARDRLINSNLRMVESMVNSITKGSPTDKDKEDLFQNGCIGLVEALDKYDSQKGTKFSTFAYYHIKKRLWEGYTSIDRTIKLPQGVIIDTTALIRAESGFIIDHNRIPTDEELESVTDFNIDRVRLLRSNIKSVMSLSPVSSEGDSYDHEIKDDDVNVEDNLIDKSFKDDLSLILESLKDRDRDMVIRKYGLHGNAPEPTTHIAKDYNITPERARILLSKSLNRIHTQLKLLGYDSSNITI